MMLALLAGCAATGPARPADDAVRPATAQGAPTSSGAQEYASFCKEVMNRV